MNALQFKGISASSSSPSFPNFAQEKQGKKKKLTFFSHQTWARRG